MRKNKGVSGVAGCLTGVVGGGRVGERSRGLTRRVISLGGGLGCHSIFWMSRDSPPMWNLMDLPSSEKTNRASVSVNW